MILEKIGIFKIRESFNITGRGIITIGHFIEGRAKIGAFAAIDILGQKTTAKITGIDWPKLDDEGNWIWGLLFSFDDKNAGQIVKEQKLKEQTIEILFPV